jgi:hypothetical protein
MVPQSWTIVQIQKKSDENGIPVKWFAACQELQHDNPKAADYLPQGYTIALNPDLKPVEFCLEAS